MEQTTILLRNLLAHRLAQCGNRRHSVSGDMEGAAKALRWKEGVLGEREKSRLI